MQNAAEVVGSMNATPSKVEKMGQVPVVGVVDKAAMEVVDMSTNEHYMLLVDANATPQSVEPELRVFVVYESSL